VKILLLEDDETLAEALEQALLKQHYSVDRANDGQLGWDYIERFEYDLIILNVNLPKRNGILFCQLLRQQRNDTPVLLLTTQHDRATIVQGLDAGADDYLVKSPDLEELLARIRALLRRRGSGRDPILTWGQLQLDPSRCEVTCAGERLHLPPKEYSLLEFFLRNPQRLVPHTLLLDRLWSADDIPTEGSLRAHIKKLRQKLRAAGVGDALETVYGIGYRLRPEPELGEWNAARTETSPAEGTGAKLEQSLSSLWKRHRKQYLDRVAVLGETIRSLQTDRNAERLLQVQQQIHILAGSLGSFGLDQASQICRSLEQIPDFSADSDRVSKLIADLRQELLSFTGVLPLVTPPAPRVSTRGRLLIVDDDDVLVERLAIAAINLDWQVERAASLAEARDRIAAQRPTAILLDLCFPGRETGYELLRELAAEPMAIPVFVLTIKEELSDRIRVAQLGGRRFIPKSLSPQRVIQSVTEVMQTRAARILAVDDDLSLLELLQTLLQPHGFELTLLNHPQQFYRTLEETNPDLVVLNIDMSEISGIELCKVVRNDVQWHRLPIVFLSAHTDPAIVQQVFAAGADDFVPKPIVQSDLLARLANRLQRL
jgi:DNA-binding response OmpR family regulator